MQINGIIFTVDLMDILTELREQLQLNGYNLLDKITDTQDNIMVSCPYHKGGQERRPSAGIRKVDGVFNCFTCHETHSLQEMISFCFGHTDDMIGAFGWNWLLKNFLTVSVEERKDVEIDMERRNISTKVNRVGNKGTSKSAVLDADGDNSTTVYVSDVELDGYRYFHPYMYKRGLTDEVIEIFDIGYDKDTRCITFPVRDKQGRTLFVARRSVDIKYFNYPQSSQKPLYGLYELYQQEKFPSDVIICESMLDALSFWTVGKYAVALNGTGSALQFKQLRDLPCRKLILCTDMDSAGLKARGTIRKNVKNKLITEYILPNGRKDANECDKEELLDLEEVF